MATKKVESKLNANGIEISVITTVGTEDDYISITDIAKYSDPDNPRYIIQNWMRNRNTIDYLGLWEELNNPSFNRVEFDAVKIDAGKNSFVMTPTKWIKETNAIGIISKSGRYGGGTLAHKDIAFEFASWLSPEFKLYVIKDYQRLKESESHRLALDWNVKRMRSLQSKLNQMAAQCDNPDAATAVKQFAGEMRYSDPVSSEALADIERDLAAAVEELQSAIVDGDSAATKQLCRKASGILAERNRLCKLNKA